MERQLRARKNMSHQGMSMICAGSVLISLSVSYFIPTDNRGCSPVVLIVPWATLDSNLAAMVPVSNWKERFRRTVEAGVSV